MAAQASAGSRSLAMTDDRAFFLGHEVPATW